LPQSAYIWQRAWSEPLLTALQEHGAEFASLIALTAEVTWKSKRPQLIRVPVNYPVLGRMKCRLGLALRVGPYGGPFGAGDPACRFLTNLARALVAEAATNGLRTSEVQLDFDCAESQLPGYRVWVEAIRKEIAPVPLVITALPAWLNQPSFRDLVAASGGYVLQVHSLEKPLGVESPFTLCDPGVALRAVRRAAAFEVPFQVALPTYGYLMAFDPSGRFIGVSAEDPAKSWPANAQLREVRADAVAMAGLVKAWSTNRPPTLKGIIWYRFPTPNDTLNWRWATLHAMIQLRAPHESVRAASRRVEAGLVEIILVNDGDLDISSRLAVEVRWQNARLVASDGLRGFEAVDEGSSALRFQTQSQSFRLPAGDEQVIGWLRFNTDREVQVEIKKWQVNRSGGSGVGYQCGVIHGGFQALRVRARVSEQPFGRG
jgi:hypothetical protein